MLSTTGRSFVSDAGAGGASFRVAFCEGGLPAAAERQSLAGDVEQMATVFVVPDSWEVAMHNRKLERSLIAHGLLGVLEVLAARGITPRSLRLPSGVIWVWSDPDGRRWLRAPSSWAPTDRTRQVADPKDVDGITSAPADEPVQIWAWIDQAAGEVRARFFGPSVGKPEDEACGSACMVLCEQLDRPLLVRHGRLGSVVHVARDGDEVLCGGRCVLDRDHG